MWLLLDVDVPELLKEGVAVRLIVPVRLDDGVPLELAEAVILELPVAVLVLLELGVLVLLALLVPLRETDGEAEPVRLPVWLLLDDGVPVLLTEGVIVLVELGVFVLLVLSVLVLLALPVPLRVAELEAEPD